MKNALILFLFLTSTNAIAMCKYSGPITPMVRDFFQQGLAVQISTFSTSMSEQVENSRLAMDLYDRAVESIETYEDAAFLQTMITSTKKAGKSVYGFNTKKIEYIVSVKFSEKLAEFRVCSKEK